MDSVVASILDCSSRTQLMDVPGEIHIFGQCLAGLSHRHNGILGNATYEKTLEALETSTSSLCITGW